MPAAEMSSVTPSSSLPFPITATGRCSGKRTAQRKFAGSFFTSSSITPPLLNEKLRKFLLVVTSCCPLSALTPRPVPGIALLFWPTDQSWICRLRTVLKTRHFGEVKVCDAHCGSDHVERLFAAGSHRFAQVQHLAQHLQHALVEAKVANSLPHAAVLHQKCSIPRHARQDLLVGIHFTDVPQPRHQQAALGCRNHLLSRLLLVLGHHEDNVGWGLARFVRKAEAMSCSSRLRPRGGGCGISRGHRHAAAGAR